MGIISYVKEKVSNERKLELLKRACGSGGLISYHKETGKIVMCGNFPNMGQSPFSFCVAFDNGHFLSRTEYIADMKLLMEASNITRNYFIDSKKKDLKSSEYDTGLLGDMVVIGNPDTMQYISDVGKDITSDIMRRAYIEHVKTTTNNAIKATEDAFKATKEDSMSKISDKLTKYIGKYGYLLNPENLEQERS